MTRWNTLPDVTGITENPDIENMVHHRTILTPHSNDVQGYEAPTEDDFTRQKRFEKIRQEAEFIRQQNCRRRKGPGLGQF